MYNCLKHNLIYSNFIKGKNICIPFILKQKDDEASKLRIEMSDGDCELI